MILWLKESLWACAVFSSIRESNNKSKNILLLATIREFQDCGFSICAFIGNIHVAIGCKSYTLRLWKLTRVYLINFLQLTCSAAFQDHLPDRSDHIQFVVHRINCSPRRLTLCVI